MTDDRVAGLPDAGTIQPGDPGHIETHDRMAELMQFAAERIGIILDPPAPKPAVIGEYGHVQAHNDLLANIEQIAREAGTAVGGPPAPVLTNPEGGSVVAFTSGGEGVGGPTIAYGAEIEPNDHGETVTVEWDDPLVGGEVSVAGTSPFTDYIVTVYGVNVAGRGESATTDAFQLNYNEATGGSETVVDNYNGTGQKWKVHTFRSAGTLKVAANTNDFRVLVVGSGGGGGVPTGDAGGGGGGGGGGVNYQAAVSLGLGDQPVTQWAFAGHTANNGGGGDGGGGGVARTGGPSGAPTRHNGGGRGPQWEYGSGGGGAGGNGATSPGGGPGGGGPGLSNSITGTAQTYGAGGTGGSRAQTGQSGKGWPGQSGGGVIVAYQIGMSTTREIQQAEAEHAAREAGYAIGYDVGVTDGIEQRNDEIRAMTEQVKEALPTKDKK